MHGVAPIRFCNLERKQIFKLNTYMPSKNMLKLLIFFLGCVDIWDPKVLRSGAGSHFRCHVLQGVTWNMVGNYLPQDCQVLVIAKNGERAFPVYLLFPF